MKNIFYVGLEPVKRNKVWVVAVYIIPSGTPPALLDSEHSFKTKRDAKLFISGWRALLDCYNRS